MGFARRPQSQPYGIVAVNDVIWYSETGVAPNTVVRFDPKTEKFQTWKIPSGGGVVRNVSLTKDATSRSRAAALTASDSSN
jgi:virginiamycin B lyase